MPVYYQDPTATLRQGHVLDELAAMPAGCAQTCVTSPPYWGLRDYGVPGVEWPAVRFIPMAGLPEVDVPAWTGCLGLEPEPLAFVGHLVHVFREVRRVLKDDGTLWLNLGDSYANDGKWGGASGGKHAKGLHGQTGIGRTRRKTGLKSKDLLGIPWRVAFALQADGWWLRSDVIWAKPNPMPESVTDRPTKAHEYVFLLAKSERYFYDAKAIREVAVGRNRHDLTGGRYAPPGQPPHTGSRTPEREPDGNRNARSVWTITQKPYHGAHSATMPPDLARTCILAGSHPGDIVLDPFNGAGTTGLVALQEGRGFEGVDLSPDYCRLAVERWRTKAPQAVLPLGGGSP